MDFFFLALCPYTVHSLSSRAWAPRNGYLLCCDSFVVTKYLGLQACSGSPPGCSCHAQRRKGNLQASDACLSGLPFPLSTLSMECKLGLLPLPSSTTGAAGGYFCSGDIRVTRVHLPRPFLHVGLCRGSKVRARSVNFKEWELGWHKPSSHIFSKSLPSSLPFQPLNLLSRGGGSGLPHFSPPSFSNQAMDI